MDGELPHTSPAFTTTWQEWLAESLLRGVAEDEIVSVMRQRGFDHAEAWRLIAAQQKIPSFRVAHRLLCEHRKLRSLTDALSDQWSQSPQATAVPVMDPPDPEAFFERFYFANRPVVVRGLVEQWPALHKWSPDYFAQEFGDTPIEISGDREGDPRFEENFLAHRREITMREFVAHVMADEGNDRYVVARNQLLQRPAFRRLLDDIHHLPGFLAPVTLSRAKLWFGPAGTLTPLHHDDSNILFVQIQGSKLVRLVEPHSLPRLYGEQGGHSSVDLDDVDLTRFPLMRDVPVTETTVRQGEALLLPLGWWHWVMSVETSISLSFVGGFDLPGHSTSWRYA
ncbi:cupin-like domain-containing protein [Streptomyces sp. M41]|uniref:cupin-like domain-containing protein n=1 Tax=Streptomyces sp. M41 TaxID=3059412 RepID=UPI00374D71AD